VDFACPDTHVFPHCFSSYTRLTCPQARPNIRNEAPIAIHVQRDMPDTTAQGSPEGIKLRDRAMFGHQLLMSTLDEASELLKLYLGLQTGAVVFFAKILTDAHSRTLVLALLAASTLLFGASALMQGT
jgi:hypothetical protein